MNDIPQKLDYIQRIREILISARRYGLRRVNSIMVSAYWHIGREIVEEEQNGKERADYGAYIIKGLSERLSKEFGQGYSGTNLRNMRQFYLEYMERTPEIRYTASDESIEASQLAENTENAEICQTVSDKSKSLLSPHISWSQYCLLMLSLIHI